VVVVCGAKESSYDAFFSQRGKCVFIKKRDKRGEMRKCECDRYSWNTKRVKTVENYVMRERAAYTYFGQLNFDSSLSLFAFRWWWR